MIRINLLPFRAARTKENIRQHASIYVLTVLLLIIVLGYWHITLGNKIDELDAKSTKMNSELKTYQAKLEEIKQINARLSLLQRKLDVINTLEANRAEPALLMAAMADLTVANYMWFQNFKADEVPKPPPPKPDPKKGGGQPAQAPKPTVSKVNISMAGIALDNKTVADFMRRLEDAPQFNGVNLLQLQKTSIAGTDLKRFDLRFVKSTSLKKDS